MFGHPGLPVAEIIPQPALDSISGDGLANFFADGHPESGTIQAVFAEKGQEQGGVNLFTLVGCMLELATAMQPGRRRKSERFGFFSQVIGKARVSGIDQSFAPLEASAAENLATRAGGHFCAKAMGSFTTKDTGLKSSLHFIA